MYFSFIQSIRNEEPSLESFHMVSRVMEGSNYGFVLFSILKPVQVDVHYSIQSIFIVGSSKHPCLQNSSLLEHLLDDLSNPVGDLTIVYPLSTKPKIP